MRASHTDPVRVLEEIKRLTVEQLGGLPGGLYQPIERALQASMADATSFHDQAALLILRQHSASHVMRFRQQLAKGFDDFRRPHAPQGGTKLGLIAPDQIDFHLAAQRASDRLAHRYQRVLATMQVRLEALGRTLDSASTLNPLAPAQLMAAFVEAYGEAELPDALGGLLFHYYEQALLRALDEVYPKVNALLAGAGFTADAESAQPIPPLARRPDAGTGPAGGGSSFGGSAAGGNGAATGSVGPGTGGGSAAGAAGSAAAGAAGAAASTSRPATGAFNSAALSAQMLAASMPAPASSPRAAPELADLRAQLHAMREAAANSEPAEPRGSMLARKPGPRRELRVQEVRSIASLLQSESPDAYARALATSGRLGDAIRGHLFEGARRLGLSPDETRFSVDEEDAIDMVAMLFESLFRSHSLQDRARRLYARLVLPYVKVALDDDAMFVQSGHPARRLLDAITEACEDNTAATPQDRELLERAAAVSQRVVAEFNEDLAVFALAHAELEELLVQQRRRVALQEERAAKATHGRERLANARAQADDIVARRLVAPPLTQAVADFLITPWRHHLVQTLLRDGADSARHAEATQLGHALVDADRLAEAGRGRELADCLIALEPAIVQCLATSGMDNTAARHGMACLVHALANPDSPRHLHVLPPSAVEEIAEEDAPKLWLAGGTDTIAHDAGVAALMRRLQPGEWLRLVDPQGEAIAVKVAWISPMTSRLLLVNRRGMRALVASPEELAVLVSAGRLMTGSEATPFDEAMRQMRQRVANGA